MSASKKYNRVFESGKGFENLKTIGIDGFKKVLERDFFADVSIKDEFVQEKGRFDLVVDVHCNFGLTESLFHLNQGNWGCFKQKSIGGGICSGANPFQEQFFNLRELNAFSTDIKEFSVHLNDVSVVVSQLYENSIVEQLPTIFESISEHFVHLTKGLSDMPYEIFVPIYEEENMFVPHGQMGKTLGEQDYFKFWGLYYTANPMMQVYDFCNKSFLEGDFFLIN